MPGKSTVSPEAPQVLIVDDDRDIAELLQSVLIDEGYRVSCLYTLVEGSVTQAVARLRPACVLLDGGVPHYDESWKLAARLASETRLPLVMLTAHRPAAREAREGTSARSRAADFAAVIEKPFDLDDVILAVRRAVERGAKRRAAFEADAKLTKEIARRLEAAGARDIGTSSRRTWVTFRTPAGDLMQLYRWEAMAVYFVGRYTPDGRRLEPLGQFTDLDAAIATATASGPNSGEGDAVRTEDQSSPTR